MKWWKNLSVSKKLYCVVGAMGLLIAMELLSLILAMRTLSAVRAFVAGEGYWSKAQKDSITAIQNYAVTGEVIYHNKFHELMKIPMGDRAARIEIEKPDMNMALATQGLIIGKNHPDDIPDVIKLLREFSHVSYIAHAVAHWKEADLLLNRLIQLEEKIHSDFKNKKYYGPVELREVMREISSINEKLTVAEDGFSHWIGAASRFIEQFLMITLILAVFTIEGTGLFLTISFSRTLTKVLNELNNAAHEVSKGNFDQMVPVRSEDELGQLAISINTMIESLKQQISAVNLRDQFMSVASHELKTPLTTLKLQAQMRRRYIERGEFHRFDPESLRRVAEDNENQLNRLIRLVDDMLDVSKIRTGKFQLQIEDQVDLVKLTKEVFKRLEPQLLETGTAIILEASGEVSGSWDAYRLEQVMINLLTNAMKYGNRKPIIVKINKDQSQAVITVLDHGIGISTNDKERIFGQFERAISSSEVSGLGLGLYIAQQIITAHHGTITVESEQGKGSTFIVKLPV